MKVTKDQILAVTQGEYSDYCLKDHFRALHDFDTDHVIAAYKATVAPDEHLGCWQSYDQDKFLAWCVEQKYIEVLSANEVQEWYIGSHGDLA